MFLKVANNAPQNAHHHHVAVVFHSRLKSVYLFCVSSAATMYKETEFEMGRTASGPEWWPEEHLSFRNTPYLQLSALYDPMLHSGCLDSGLPGS
jgi:hypothetical protein